PRGGRCSGAAITGFRRGRLTWAGTIVRGWITPHRPPSTEATHEARRQRRRGRGRRPAREGSAAVGAAGRARSARHEVRVWRRLLRGVHRPGRRAPHEVL